MSQRDRDRLVVVRQVASGRMAVAHAAELLGLSRRQVNRIVERFREEGDGATLQRGRGGSPNNAKPELLRMHAMDRAKDPIFEGFGPRILREHLLREPALAALAPPWVSSRDRWSGRGHTSIPQHALLSGGSQWWR